MNKHKPNGIFNLAAETHVDRSIDDPRDFIKSNILGVYNLLETIKKYFIPGDTHWNKNGHLLIYKHLLKVIKKNNF